MKKIGENQGNVWNLKEKFGRNQMTNLVKIGKNCGKTKLKAHSWKNQ